MSKWLSVVVLFLVAGAWYLSDGEGGESGRDAAVQPVKLQATLDGSLERPASQPRGQSVEGPSEPAALPESAAQGAAASAAGVSEPPAAAAVELPYDQEEESATPSAESAKGGFEVSNLLERAAGLVEAGQRREARELIQAGMTRVTTPHEQARLGMFLVQLVDQAGEQRQLLTRALRMGVVRGSEYDDVGRQLARLNRDPRSSLFGLVPSEQYTVQPNDSLWKLCNQTFPEQFGVTPEVGLVKLFNGLGSNNLQVGQTLLVPVADVMIGVDREELGLVAYIGDVALVAYRVGLGKEERTPRGEFVVRVKQEEPTWYREGRAIPYGNPENILGTRWMGFENNPGAMGYGIHGTELPASVGKNESMGCVRMRNEDVEALFELVPRGTRVHIP